MLAVVTFGFGSEAWAQTAVCSNSPGAQDRVECREPSTSTDGIDIDLQDVDISITDSVYGVLGRHAGTGDVDIRVRDSIFGGSSLALGGISGHHLSSGDVDIEVRDSTVNFSGRSRGVHGQHDGSGNVDIEIWGSTITTSDSGTGVGYGIWGVHNGSGYIAIRTEGGSITTTSNSYPGIIASHTGTGDIDVELEDGRIMTGGYLAHGISAGYSNTDPDILAPMGNIEIRTRDHAIETTGTGVYPDASVLDGTYAYGIFAFHRIDGNTIIDLGEGSSVTTHGKNSHGIVTYHFGTESTRSMDITVDGSVTVNGEAAQGVRVGTLTTSDAPDRMAGLDSQGYRLQTVRVNGSITSAGEGVFLVNGGRVIIGPEGRIRSSSGIAILATGTVPEDSTDSQNVVAEIPPKLHVHFDLKGRQRVADAIGDDWILNDGGGTTIAVNNTVLHDWETGATGAMAANGVWDVTMLADGLTVTDRSADPWTTSARDSSTIADRDFSASDFTEVERMDPVDPTPPEPEPEPTQPVFMEEYAPRAALYESLPGLLLRLDAGAPVRRPEELAWVQVGYGAGRGEADRSETGASYDFDRIEAAVGISRAWGDNLGGSVWLRRLQSEVKVDMPAGSGELELHGVGAGVQGHWREADGLYVSGALSWTDFDVDASSEKRGRLVKDVGADLWQARLEAGYLMARGGGLTLRPRAWAWHAEADVDGFTDAVGAQVSGVDESRTAAGLGLLAELARSESSLYGSVDVESVFAGEETTVRVSGQDLDSESEKTRVWIGMGGQQQGKRVTLRGGLRLGDPGGRNQEVSASVSVSGRF